MDTVEGVPKSLIHWSVVLLAAILAFSILSFSRLRSNELRLARQRVVIMDWDGVTSIAWIVTASSLLLISILTYLRIDGYRGFDLPELLQWGYEGERRARDWKDALWHLGTPILAALTLKVWSWAASDRAQRRWRGPARNSRWLIAPIAVTAGLLLVIGFAYRRAFWTPVHPHFDTSGCINYVRVRPSLECRSSGSSWADRCVRRSGPSRHPCSAYRGRAGRPSPRRSWSHAMRVVTPVAGRSRGLHS